MSGGEAFRPAPRGRLRWGTWLALAVAIGSVASGSAFAGHAASTSRALRWLQITSTTTPPSRDWAAMAYDAADRCVVEYGGYNPTTAGLYSDTWTFQAGVWTQRFPTAHPTATSGLTLAYDPTLKGVLAFGGQAAYGAAYYNDTWLYKAGAWTNITPSGPSPPIRSQYSMTYDAFDGVMLLFGGQNATSDLSDTWAFNGTAWTQVHPAVSPPGRHFAGIVYDPIAHLVLLVGGYNFTKGGEAGTWAYRSGTWANSTHPGPLPSLGFPYVTNARNGTPILFGGILQSAGVSVNTTYEFLGTHWVKVHSIHAPSVRNNGGFAYDARDRWVVLFGGRSPTGWLGDTWIIL